MGSLCLGLVTAWLLGCLVAWLKGLSGISDKVLVSQIFLVIARIIFPIGKIILWSIPIFSLVGKFGRGGFHS